MCELSDICLFSRIYKRTESGARRRDSDFLQFHFRHLLLVQFDFGIAPGHEWPRIHYGGLAYHVDARALVDVADKGQHRLRIFDVLSDCDGAYVPRSRVAQTVVGTATLEVTKRAETPGGRPSEERFWKAGSGLEKDWSDIFMVRSGKDDVKFT